MTHISVPETVEAAGGSVTLIERPGGIRLRVARFDPNGIASSEPRLCVFLSGYTEFIEKNLESVGELTARGFSVLTLDWRGQGLSDRLLADRHKGHIDRMETHLGDLQAVLDGFAGFRDGTFTIVAHSMGAHLALRYCIDRPERVNRAVLIAPMLGVGRTGLPNWLARWLVEVLCLTPLAKSYIFGGAGYGPRRQKFEGNLLTHDQARFERLHRLMTQDPDLVLADPTFSWVRSALRSIEAVMAPAVLERARTPLLLAVACQDTIVSNAAIEAAALRLPDAQILRLADAKHEILGELEPVRRAFWNAVDAFLDTVPTNS